MPLIPWTPDLSVNVPEIDRQHQRLVELLNRLHAGMDAAAGADVLRDVFDELVNYTLTHFADEEHLMHTVDYPDFEAHVVEHTKLKLEVQALKARYDNGQTNLKMTTFMFLRDWLVNHMRQSDRQAGVYIAARVAQAAAAAQ